MTSQIHFWMFDLEGRCATNFQSPTNNDRLSKDAG